MKKFPYIICLFEIKHNFFPQTCMFNVITWRWAFPLLYFLEEWMMFIRVVNSSKFHFKCWRNARKIEIYYFLTATLSLSRLKASFSSAIQICLKSVYDVDEQGRKKGRERWVRKWVSNISAWFLWKYLTRVEVEISYIIPHFTHVYAYISMLSICFWQFRVHRSLPLMRSMSSSLALIFLQF